METKKEYLEKLLQRYNWVGKGKSVERAYPFLLTVSRLRQLSLWLESEYSTTLEAVPMDSVSDIKRFCDDMLDAGACHPWKRSLRDNHACLRTRASVASTLFLFRKVLPAEKLSKKAALRVAQNYIKKMTTPQEAASSDYLSFAYHRTREMFRDGWDSGWFRAADSFCLPVKSCLENRAGAGGVRSMTNHEQTFSRGRFVSTIQADYEDFIECDELVRRKVCLGRETKVLTIWTGGKNRTISMFSSRRSFLSPLHQIIYNRLSRFPWLVRGDAEKKIFSDFILKPDEVVVSGDYKEATDNLNLSVSQCILRAMRNGSKHVPTQVWDSAEEALVSEFQGGGVQRRGQLMGSLLSFPLLCLSNFLAFKWSVPRDVPVKINGDDIVFVATLEERDRWFKGIGEAGFVLSKGKTLVTRTLFSLNSTFFLSRRGRVETVPIIRSTCVWNPVDSPASLKGRLVNASGFKKMKEKIEIEVLKTCAPWVWRSQRSILRGLGCDVSYSVLRGSNLAARESFYSHLDREPACPAPWKRWQHWGLPTGWRTEVVSDGLGDDVGAMHSLVESTWSSFTTADDISHQAYLRALREGTYSFVPLSLKAFRMLGPTSLLFSDLQTKIKKHTKKKRGDERVWRKVCASRLSFVRG